MLLLELIILIFHFKIQMELHPKRINKTPINIVIKLISLSTQKPIARFTQRNQI